MKRAILIITYISTAILSTNAHMTLDGKTNLGFTSSPEMEYNEMFTPFEIKRTEISIFQGGIDFNKDFSLKHSESEVSQELILSKANYKGEAFTLKIYSQRGELVLNNELKQQSTIINTKSLSATSYIVVIMQDNTPVQSFNLIKTEVGSF